MEEKFEFPKTLYRVSYMPYPIELELESVYDDGIHALYNEKSTITQLQPFVIGKYEIQLGNKVSTSKRNIIKSMIYRKEGDIEALKTELELLNLENQPT